MPYSGVLGAAMGDKGSVLIIQAKALLDTSKFTFGAKSIMINDNARFFGLINCITKRYTASLEILIVDEYSFPREAYIMWKLNSKHVVSTLRVFKKKKVL